MHIVPRNQRHVLMIAHAFPPTGGSGVQRPAKFAKYLPQFGWTPHVWTVDHVDALPTDPTLCNDLPREVTVHRMANPDRLRAFANALARWSKATSGSPIGARVVRPLVRAAYWRAKRKLALRLPDDAIAWARASLKPVLKLIKQQRIDLLFSTFSPASCHLMALQLKRRAGLPWVADFRDLWTDDCRYRETPRRRAAHRKLEDAILREADIVVGVTPSQTELLARRVPGKEFKFVTITNGFDPADFADLKDSLCASSEPGAQATGQTNRQWPIANCRVPESLGWGTDEQQTSVRTNKFVLAHVGRLDAHRIHDEWFSALRLFAAQLGAAREQFNLRVIGHCNDQTRRSLRETGITCEFVDYVSHTESIREMCNANALLLLLPTGPNAETIIAGKVFEYLAARRPILAIGPSGSETLRIVADHHAGITTPFEESRIARALENILGLANTDHDEAKSNESASELRSTNPARNLNSFSRIALTRQLAEVFDHLTACTQPIRARSMSDGLSIRTASASEGPESSIVPVLPAIT